MANGTSLNATQASHQLGTTVTHLGVPQWLLGAFAGWLLAVTWDYLKTWREDRRTQQVILAILRDELLANAEIAASNRSIVETELQLLPRNQREMRSLLTFHSSMWDILRTSFPRNLFTESNLTIIRKSRTNMELANEVIRSRQQWVVNNSGMTNFIALLKKYDEQLVWLFEETHKSFEEVQRVIFERSGTKDDEGEVAPQSAQQDPRV